MIDPSMLRGELIARPERPSRYELKIHEIAPEDIEPNGDRYVVEVIDLDETVMMGQLLVITGVKADPDPNNPMAEPTVESRGVFAAVIIRAGTGHLLGLPDPWVVRRGPNNQDLVSQKWASVDMFFGPGDVVLVDRTTKGRALMIVGRECRIINQLDVLAKIHGVRLERKDGAWTQVDG